MQLAHAIRLALAALALGTVSAARADGQVYVYGYDDSGLTSDYAVTVNGSAGTPANGTTTLSLPAGATTLVISRGGKELLKLPLEVVDAKQRSVLVTMKAAETSFVVQDTASGEELASGSEPVPGMAATLNGKLVDSNSGAPIAGAAVQLLEPALETTSAEDGSFAFEGVAPGSYTLVVDAEGFQTRMEEGLALDAGATISRELALVPPGQSAPAGTADGETTMGEVAVTGQQRGTQAASTDERRMSANVAEVVSTEQLSRGGESEVSSALKRVTGLSLVGGKFIYVRGLGERYSSVLLNGAQIPSPDPTRRVVPLDLFPTEVLESVIVQKNFSPDMPGEFGGGTVALRTREAPAKRYARVALGATYVDGTSFEDGLRYDGDSDDWTGRDQARGLPAALAQATAAGQPLTLAGPGNPNGATAAQIEQYGEELAALGFDQRVDELGPDSSFSAALGGTQELGGIPFSLLAATRYSHGWDSNDESRKRYGTSNSDPLFVVSEFERERSERSIDLSTFVNLGAEIATGHKLSFTQLLVRQTLDQTQFEQGYDDSPDTPSRIYELEWTENSLIANQLGGTHYFPQWHELGVDWQVTDSRAAREAPAKRRYRYEFNGTEYIFSRQTDGNEITYEDLDDGVRQFKLGFQMPFTYGAESQWFVTYALGFDRVDRERESDIRRFRYTVVGTGVINNALLRQSLDNILNPANIGSSGFALREVTRSVDNYTADQRLDAAFFNVDIAYTDRFRLALGARFEDNTQSVDTFDLSNPQLGNIRAQIDDSDLLPALAATWTYSDSAQLRFGYARTLSRPDFRELSPAPFFDPLLDVESSGNPDLEQTQIDNLDLRWEYYFEGDQNVAAALFYKKFESPIERVSVPGTGGLLSYQNAESARNRGIEVEGFKRLDWFGEWGADYFAGFNAAYIKSDVELGTAGSIQTNRSRPLQGQSKHLINLELGYKPQAEDARLEATLLYNVFGERIAQVGVLGLPDVYEQPFNQLDFTLKYRFAPEWSLGLKLRNLLDEEIEFSQGGLPTRLYEPGREIGVTVEWKPFAAD